MVEMRHHQRLVWEGRFPEQAQGWREEWMRQVDAVLDDAELLEAAYTLAAVGHVPLCFYASSCPKEAQEMVRRVQQCQFPHAAETGL